MKSSQRFGSTQILQIALGVFIFILGLNGLTSYNSTLGELGRAASKLFGGGSNQTIAMIVAILELVAGVILVAGVFLPIDSKALFFAAFAICILWIAKIVLNYFFGSFLEPSLLTWLEKLSLEIVILVSLWNVSMAYK